MSANSAEPVRRVDVVLVKGGRTKIRYAAELLSDDGNRIAVRAPWAGDGVRDFGFVRFEPGDVFTEYYWRDRWYSVKTSPGSNRTKPKSRTPSPAQGARTAMRVPSSDSSSAA